MHKSLDIFLLRDKSMIDLEMEVLKRNQITAFRLGNNPRDYLGIILFYLILTMCCSLISGTRVPVNVIKSALNY